MDEGNTQILTIKTDVEAGRLLLHWGVEGGKNYKGGWRLPDLHCRPDGTQQYKDRALQTPFRSDHGRHAMGHELAQDSCHLRIQSSVTVGHGSKVTGTIIIRCSSNRAAAVV
jgi:hypothetical protein